MCVCAQTRQGRGVDRFAIETVCYCDCSFHELFKGYGFDKNSHALQVAYAGYHFLAAPESFVIHIDHPIASWGGPPIPDQLVYRTLHQSTLWLTFWIVC
jgi:hypothetical protein